jgi:8-oxo-dGTP pyrophosphatase MutT (NUDIX family)
MDKHLTQAPASGEVIKPRSAGAVVFRRSEQGVWLLVLRAFGHWDFPKGLVEDGESELITARREVWEETGLGEIKFALGEDYRETLPYAGGKIARYYLAETEVEKITLPVSLELGRPEHDEWRWVSLDEADDLLPPRLAVVLEWVRAALGG